MKLAAKLFWTAALSALVSMSAPAFADGKPTLKIGYVEGWDDSVATSNVAARIIERDPRSGELKYSEKQVMTYHFNPPGMGDPAGRGDATWNAYVKLYRDNSDMLSETVTCMPRAGQ